MRASYESQAELSCSSTADLCQSRLSTLWSITLRHLFVPGGSTLPRAHYTGLPSHLESWEGRYDPRRRCIPREPAWPPAKTNLELELSTLRARNTCNPHAATLPRAILQIRPTNLSYESALLLSLLFAASDTSTFAKTCFHSASEGALRRSNEPGADYSQNSFPVEHIAHSRHVRSGAPRSASDACCTPRRCVPDHRQIYASDRNPQDLTIRQ